MKLLFFSNNSSEFGGLIAFGIVVIILVFVFVIGYAIYIQKKKKEIREKIDLLASNAIEMNPNEFFKIRNKSFGGQGSPKYARQYNFEGVYILYNETKKMYYVGQATKILDRVNAHFTGKGNGDVYADYKYGDSFKIRMIALEKSGFCSLNELERHTISKYNAFARGYNKTRGNR